MCDVLDGYVARLNPRRQSMLGADLDSLSDTATGKVKYFEGTPIPTSILIVLLLALAFYLARIDADLWLGSVQIGPALLHPLAA